MTALPVTAWRQETDVFHRFLETKGSMAYRHLPLIYIS